MSKLSRHKGEALLAAGLFLTGCSIDSYLTDEADVQCDGNRTKADLEGTAQTVFTVHDAAKHILGYIAVRRHDGTIAIAPEEKTSDTLNMSTLSFSEPALIADGPEFVQQLGPTSWTVDADMDSVVIAGSCD